MFQTELSLNATRSAKTQRILDWVQQSFHHKSLKCLTNSSTQGVKRRHIDVEDDTDMMRDTSDPVPPRKFYQNDNKIRTQVTQISSVQLPSTPESKMSSNSTCFSPRKCDIVVRKGPAKQLDPVISTDSESEPTTPIKRLRNNPDQIFTLSYGLDSPDSGCTTKSVMPSSKRFSKLGHRVQKKSPLQMYKKLVSFNTVRKSRQSSSPVNRNSSLKACVPADCHSEASSAGESSQCKVDTTVSKEELDRCSNTLLDNSCEKPQKGFNALFTQGYKCADSCDNQMIIDAGQKDGMIQCPLCQMVYMKSDINESTLHRKYHSRLSTTLKFVGWKKEHISEHGINYRVIYVDYTDPPYCHKKVQSIKDLLDQELGYVNEVNLLTPTRRVYLYIDNDNKMIVGVCLVESVTKANRLVGNSVSEQTTPAQIGINRLWVFAKYRRQGVATSLLDNIRSTYNIGLCVPKSRIAFSDPTSCGRSFAERYTGTPNFLVYKP